jgi:hypothetical protein
VAVATAVALAVIAHGVPARGDSPATERCSARVKAWIGDAAVAAGTLAYAVTCGPDRVVLRLEPIDAAPLEVEVTRSPDGAFRRVGGLGLSPLLQVDDWKRVPAARREPFERLAGWVEAHPDRVSFGGGALPESLRSPLERARLPPGSPWMLVAALALGLLASRRRTNPARADRMAALALFAFAWPLRLALGAWGPLRINGLGALWVMAAAVDPLEARHYGPGYAEVFSLVARHLPLAPDDAVFATNTVVSALLPPLLFSLVRRLGIDRRRGVIVALALTLDPVSIRIAATESYVPVITALAGASSLAATLAAIDAGRRRWRAAVAMALAAGLLAAQAARVHPAAWVPVALAPLAAFGVEHRSPGRRLGIGLGILSAVGATVLATSLPDLLQTLESSLTGETMPAHFSPPTIGGSLVAAALLALVVARPRWPVAWGGLAAFALASSRANYAQSPLWLASFDRLYVLPLGAAAAALLPAFLARLRALLPTAAVALLTLFVLRAPAALEGRTTDHLEYRWARDWLRHRLPPSCRVAYVAFAGHRNLFLPTYVASPPLPPEALLRLDGREPIDARLVLGEPRCTLYVRSSLCSSEEGRPVCDALERQLVLEPVERVTFPAVPSNGWLPYDRDPVEVEVARVVALR